MYIILSAALASSILGTSTNWGLYFLFIVALNPWSRRQAETWDAICALKRRENGVAESAMQEILTEAAKLRKGLWKVLILA